MDPQQLTFIESAKALWALGRVPFAFEVPTWTLLGCLVSSQLFPVTNPLDLGFLRGFDWWAALQCMLVTWATNVAINYGNEYFDWNLDRPGQVAAIKADMERRNRQEWSVNAPLTAEGNGYAQKTSADGTDNGTAVKPRAKKQNQKIYGNTTRIIHDGTFPPWVSLLCSLVVESLLLTLILTSRSLHSAQPSSSRPGVAGSPFKGLAIQIGAFCTFLSHSYVGPPFRLHYNGWGELVSALFLAPVAFIFGMVGHYTAVSGKPVNLTDLSPKSVNSASGFGLDNQMWLLIGAFYFLEQARIFVMHIHDIETDKAGGKRTFVSRIGRVTARSCYVAFNFLALVLIWQFARTLSNPQPENNMFMRLGGKIVPVSAMNLFSSLWIGSLVLVAVYTAVVVVIVFKGIGKEIEEHEEKKSSGPKTPSNDANNEQRVLVPTLKMYDCAMLVSLQILATPVVFILTLLMAGAVAGSN